MHPRRSSHGRLRRNEPQRALARLNKSKIDALIVDCDLNGSSQFLRELQSAENPKDRPPGNHGRPTLQSESGRDRRAVCLREPISVEQAVRTLSAARSMILDGRLRYHRAGLEVPVSLNCKGRKPKDAYLVNVSQGGMQIHTNDPVETAKALQVSFELPGARSGLKAKAEIAWQDKRGNMGIRFVKLAPQQHRTLQLWLAQQYFAN